MSFLRPEAAAALKRWREVGLALGGVAFGLWLSLRGGWFYGVVGALVGAFSLGLAITALRRLRFRQEGDAPGVLELDEGAIGYFGPTSGGAVALSELARIDLTHAGPHPAWRLTQADGRAITIPVAASGAERLFDVFGALPGARAEAFLTALEAPDGPDRTLWRRPGAPGAPAASTLPRP